MDLITRDRISPTEEPRWYMPAGVNGWEPERTVYTMADPEKQAEARDEWEAAQFHAHRGSVLALATDDTEHGHVVDPNAERSPEEIDREERECTTLYARLQAGRQPWMHPKTYKAFMDRQRREDLRRRQRSAIIGLLRNLGRDPMSEAVVQWVTDQGYDAALAKLSAAAQRQGVAA